MTIMYQAPGVITCTFTDCSGSGQCNGHMYYWDFSERFGPLFTTKTGRELKKQPGPRTYAWIAFERWLAARKATQSAKA